MKHQQVARQHTLDMCQGSSSVLYMQHDLKPDQQFAFTYSREEDQAYTPRS